MQGHDQVSFCTKNGLTFFYVYFSYKTFQSSGIFPNKRFVNIIFFFNELNIFTNLRAIDRNILHIYKTILVHTKHGVIPCFPNLFKFITQACCRFVASLEGKYLYQVIIRADLTCLLWIKRLSWA